MTNITPQQINALVDAFRCPIGGNVMVDPVILCGNGVSYERVNIERWLQEHGTDPVSDAPLYGAGMRLIPNKIMRDMRPGILQFSLTVSQIPGNTAGGPAEDV